MNRNTKILNLLRTKGFTQVPNNNWPDTVGDKLRDAVDSVWGLQMRANKWADVFVISLDDGDWKIINNDQIKNIGANTIEKELTSLMSEEFVNEERDSEDLQQDLKDFVTIYGMNKINAEKKLKDSYTELQAQIAAAKKKESLEEKLSASQPASVWIQDFIDSTNPMFKDKTKKERISMALGAYYAAQKNEEYGAGFEGTDALRDKYIKDTPRQSIQQFKTEMNQQTYKTYQEFEAQHKKMYPSHTTDQIQAAWKTYSKAFEMEEAEGSTVESVYNDLSKMNDSALRGILRRMDHSDFNDIKDQSREDIIGEILILKFGQDKALEFLENPDNFKMEEAFGESWVVYNKKQIKSFKSRKGAYDYATKNGGVVYSAEYYHDNQNEIKSGKLVKEEAVQESRDFKSFSKENLILWLQTNWTSKKVSPQFRQELDAAVREAQSRGLYKYIKIEPQKTDSVQEAINIGDYMATSEKSQFGGYTPKVVDKNGKVMYSGQASYNTPDEAKDHAEDYLKQYASGISEPRVPVKGTYGLKEEKESYDSWIIKPREGNGDGVKVKAPDETSAIEIALGRKPSQNEIDFFNFHYILIHEKTNVSTLRNMKIVELATKCYDSDLVKQYVEQHYKPKTSALEIKESFRSFVSNKTIV